MVEVEIGDGSMGVDMSSHFLCCSCLPRPGPSSSQLRFRLSRFNARIDLTGFHHRSNGDKSVGCLLQANWCLTSCGEAPQSVQMSLGSPNTLCLWPCNRWKCPDRSWERVHRCLWFSLCSSSDIGGVRSFSTLLLPRILVADSTACVFRFRRLSFLLAPSLGRTVELCLEWRVSFMGLGLGS